MSRVRIFPLASLAFVALLAGCATTHKSGALPPEKAAPAPASAETPARPARPINVAGLAIIKDSEGHNLKPYQDGGRWYVGYGHAIDGPGAPISEEEAERLLR